MKLRSLIVCVAVLAVLAGTVYFVRRPGPPPSTDARLNQPLVDRATLEKAAKLTLSDQGKSVTLARQADGAWKVASYYDMPVDFSKLASFVSSLTDAKVERLVTSNADRIARLEFKDTKIALGDAAGKDTWSVTLGKTPELGGGRYVRFGDEQKAYLTNLSAWLDAEPKNWANAEILNVKPDDIASVEIPFEAGGTVKLTRAKKDDAWTATPTPANQKVNTAKVSSVLSSLGNIRFSETTDLNDANFAAAKEHLRRFTLTTFDKRTVEIALGRKPEEKKIKPPAATADGKSGPAALGSLSDLGKKDEKLNDAGKSGDASKSGEGSKPLTPEFETIPAGPVFVVIKDSDPKAPVNALMEKRAFQIAEYTFTSLPQKSDELFEAVPPPSASTPSAPGNPPASGPASPAAPKPEEKK
jgi:hypothetical protein